MRLFFGDIPTDVQEDAIYSWFQQLGSVADVRVMRDDSGCSRGFAFVDMPSNSEAMAAIEYFNGSEFEGCRLRCARARSQAVHEETPRPSAGATAHRPTTRLFIGNLVNDVAEQELLELCSVCGDVRAVDIMRGQDGLCRGFGCVQFQSVKSAELAIRELDGAVLRGRRLKVAFSETEKRLRA